MARQYGLSYQGSKSKLADRIMAELPSARVLYDLFAGGCAITHCALLSGKYERVHANDISDMPKLFVDAINGEYRDERRWISRDEFFMFKDSDPYIRSCWSFGSKIVNYIYSREIEPYKKALHEMLTADTLNERRIKYRTVVRELFKQFERGARANTQTESLQSLECLQRLQSLECLQSLQSLQSLQYSISDYRDIEILPDSVIYCDIPYRDTSQKNVYNVEFDYEAFYSWCEQQEQPLFISEYSMPEDRFACVAQWEVTSSMSATNNACKRVEKLFRPKHQTDLK